MELAIYTNPWDLRELEAHGGLRRLAKLGYREVVVAASYHAGRWLVPWSGSERVRFLEDGVVHYRPSGDYGALRPLPSALVQTGGASPLQLCCEGAADAGMRVRAWLVGTHNTRLGTLHADDCVENAFGDRYVYALCPARPAVQRHLLAMVADVAAHDGLHAVELEAFGWMGWKHGSHHDKSSFTPKGRLDYALSLCCCDVCGRRIAEAGGDPDAVRAHVRGLVDAAVRDADAIAPPADEPADGDELLQLAARARQLALHELAAQLDGAAGRKAVAVQVHPDPWFTGSQLPLPQAAGFAAADERVLTAYGEAPETIARQLMAPALEGIASKRLCLWPKAPQLRNDDELRRLAELARSRGFGSIAIYQLGLLPWRTIERVAKILAA